VTDRSFSHRDHRVRRHIGQTLAGIALGSLGLLGISLLAAPAALALAALAGLALLGGAALLVGERALKEYERDLRAVAGGEILDGFLRAEVQSEVGLDRPVGLPSTRSPLSRPRMRSPDPRPSAVLGP
jgi:hypothetical protein